MSRVQISAVVAMVLTFVLGIALLLQLLIAFAAFEVVPIDPAVDRLPGAPGREEVAWAVGTGLAFSAAAFSIQGAQLMRGLRFADSWTARLLPVLFLVCGLAVVFFALGGFGWLLTVPSVGALSAALVLAWEMKPPGTEKVHDYRDS